MSVSVVVPAAGTGRRFGGDLPKQYLPLAGRAVIEHTLERLLAIEPRCIVVAVNAADSRWQGLPIFANPLIRTVTGGAERADSVRLALASLEEELAGDHRVLVHDVARPCVAVADIRRLMARVGACESGGILAAPVSDTLKRAGPDHRIETTVDRSPLWAAMTPQLFPFGLLVAALEHCRAQGLVATDEAMAVELMGLRPLLVEGRRDNIKITRPEDLAVAETILRHQQGPAAASEEKP